MDFIKPKFSEWFSRQINIETENGHRLDNIEADYQLSVLKPLHANLLLYLHNHMSGPEGKEIILSCWKKLGTFDAIHLGSTYLLSLDHFADSCPLMETEPTESLSLMLLFLEEIDCFRGMMKIIARRIILNGNRMVTYQWTMLTKIKCTIIHFMCLMTCKTSKWSSVKHSTLKYVFCSISNVFFITFCRFLKI